jgi:hypothetical protein
METHPKMLCREHRGDPQAKTTPTADGPIDYLIVASPSEEGVAIESGWFCTLPEAMKRAKQRAKLLAIRD